MEGALRRGGAFAMVCTVSALLLTLSGGPQAELLEVDGISLDAHAAAQLSKGDTSGTRVGSSALSMHLSHMNSKSINKLLKNNEKGEIDGISLDSHAMAELSGGVPSDRAPHANHDARKSKASSRAQRLLDEGKQELDSRQWKAAVRLFARAKRIWRRQDNEEYRWADSLEHDVLRLHPGARPVGARSAHTPPAGSGRPDMRTAVKQLSSGHAFRSLYGLLRDQHAMEAAHHGEGVAKKAVEEAKRVIAPYRSLMDAPARTEALAEVRKDKQSKLGSALASAERELERKGKMELLHEKARIVKMARQLARAAAAKAARSEVRLGAPPAQLLQGQPVQRAPGTQLAQAPSQEWSSSFGPQGQHQEWTIAPGQSLAEGPTLKPMSTYVGRQNREMQSRLAFPANEQHLPLTEQVHNALMRQVPAAAENAIGERPSPRGEGAAAPSTPYGRFHRRGRLHFDLDQVQPRYPSAAAPFAPQPPQVTEGGSRSPLKMREQVMGQNKVPVVNINLPHGQVVPPGQYYMDGSLVQDLAGHWDYVGKLVPASPRESAV